jgi:hypothetical protein
MRGKKKVNEDLKQIIPVTDYDGYKNNVEYFNCLEEIVTSIQNVLVKLSPGFPWQKKKTFSSIRIFSLANWT